MLRKYIFSATLALSLSTASYAQQDLIKTIPADVNFFAAINSPTIIQQSSSERINQLLEELGIYKEIRQNGIAVKDINDLDIDFKRNAYVYQSSNDSTYYVGVRLPLKKDHQLENNVFKSLYMLPEIHGYKHGISTDKTIHFAWNSDNVLILTGGIENSFFNNDSQAAKKYGIEKIEYEYPGPVETVTEVPSEMDAIADTSETIWQYYDFEASDTIPPAAINVEGSFADVKKQSDKPKPSLFERNKIIRQKNEQIKKELFRTWIDQAFVSFLAPKENASKVKYLNQYDKKKTLVHFWAKDLTPIYIKALGLAPRDLISYGSNLSEFINVYNNLVLDILQDENSLKLHFSTGVSKAVAEIIKPIYNQKMNSKFARYIPENHLGYFSTNLNTEAYLKSIPKFMQYAYGSFDFWKVGETMDIVGTTLEIALDEKALSKVIGGDQIVFINDLKKVQKEYIDYQYDEETFEYNQIKKTKDDYIPTFLWMFSSEDQRIFKKLLDLGMKENKVVLDQGLYTIQEHAKSEVFYSLFKDDMIFVSNDKDQLMSIKNNTFKASRDSKIKKQIFGNTISAVTHLTQIPTAMEKMGIPLYKKWGDIIGDLGKYGDLSLTSKGFKNSRIEAEVSVEFPNDQKNAIQYILDQMINLSTRNKY